MRSFAFHRPTTLYEMSALLGGVARQHAAGRRDDVAADHQAAAGGARRADRPVEDPAAVRDFGCKATS